MSRKLASLVAAILWAQTASAHFYQSATREKAACEGSVIARELRGTYHAAWEGEPRAMIRIGTDSITTITGQRSTTEKAWTCLKDDALMIVKKSPRNLYRSNLVLRGGDYLLLIDEVTRDRPLQSQDIQKFLREGQVTYLRKESRPGSSRPAPGPDSGPTSAREF